MLWVGGAWSSWCWGGRGSGSWTGCGYGGAGSTCGSCGSNSGSWGLGIDDGDAVTVDDAIFRLQGVIDGRTGGACQEASSDASGDSSDSDAG